MLRATFGLILAFTLLSCASNKEGSVSAAAGSKETGARRNSAPPFSLRDTDGKIVNLADYKGKVVLLNFWATWCGPCKVEIPWFVEFEQKYKDRGFAVLGVAMDEDGWDIVKPYLTKNKINYRIVLGDDKIADSFGGVESLPTTYVLDKDGGIVSEHVGLVSKSDYEQEIVKLLGGTADSGSRDSGILIAGANHP
ncbi:MAG: redoxin domain-containing protein [Bryobacteraceae bacterium]|nr:redoxin domain-containing protein [Bryobacteraceae bacterium]